MAPGMNAARAQRAAAFLEAAAELVAISPRNVLDAFRQLDGSDQVRGDAYYALLTDLAPHVEYLAPWSDAETNDRVAHRCRRAAKTLRGQLPRVAAAPPLHELADDQYVAGHRRRRRSG
jgi:siroheme synthase (precorrin-2 oxidase/ferrochelatase)